MCKCVSLRCSSGFDAFVHRVRFRSPGADRVWCLFHRLRFQARSVCANVCRCAAALVMMFLFTWFASAHQVLVAWGACFTGCSCVLVFVVVICYLFHRLRFQAWRVYVQMSVAALQLWSLCFRPHCEHREPCAGCVGRLFHRRRLSCGVCCCDMKPVSQAFACICTFLRFLFICVLNVCAACLMG